MVLSELAIRACFEIHSCPRYAVLLLVLEFYRQINSEEEDENESLLPT